VAEPPVRFEDAVLEFDRARDQAVHDGRNSKMRSAEVLSVSESQAGRLVREAGDRWYRRNAVMTRTRKEAATHEAGHVIAAWLVYGLEGVRKVRIKNVEKLQVWTKVRHQPLGNPDQRFRAKVLIALAGVAAEYLLLDKEPNLSRGDVDYEILTKVAVEFGRELKESDLREWCSKSKELLEPQKSRLKAIADYLEDHDNLGREKLVQLLGVES
jgi:hypothetical protein